jgi:hypothetical protein
VRAGELRTDVFRDQVHYSQRWKERLARNRGQGLDAVRAAGILVDLFLSYRAVKGYAEMVSLAGRIPRPLAATPLVREQLGLALNRLGRPEEAERVLLALIRERGPSSETYADPRPRVQGPVERGDGGRVRVPGGRAG